jgi:hypothetical protein
VNYVLESEEKEEKKHLGFLNWEGISKESQSKKAKEARKLVMKESILIMCISLTCCLFCDVVVQNSNGVFNK